jgi:hypothetical protein
MTSERTDTGLPLTVTFDTNTLNSVIFPNEAQRNTSEDGRAINSAIKVGQVRGFFSETLITIEGIPKKERTETLGKNRVVTSASTTSKNTITLSIGFQHPPNELPPKSSERVKAAYALGMRILRSPARIGAKHLKDERYPLYEPEGGVSALVSCMDKVNYLATKIERRHLGRAVAVKLGREFSRRANAPEPELWLQGLGRANRSVARAVAEWADGDAVAAHYGFGIQLFCTEDFASSAGTQSVFSKDNRRCLTENFGVTFVTLSQLAEMLRR